MNDIVIVGGVRTPTGSHGGALRAKTAVDLGVLALKTLIDRTGVDPALFEEVIVGCAGQPSEAANIGHVLGLMAGVPQHVPGYTVHRNCASGMEAIISGYRAVASGEGDLYLIGGTESMSNAPYLVKGARWGLKLRHGELTDGIWEALTDPVCGLIMGATAENLAERYEITREEQDKYAVESHKKAFKAQRMDKFKDEIVPVEIVKRVGGQEVAREVVSQDEGVNPTLTVSKAALYPTVFKKNGTVTPGQRLPVERRSRRGDRHNGRSSGRVGSQATRPHRQLFVRRRGPGLHGHWPGLCHAKGLEEGRPEPGRHGRHRVERGLRRPGDVLRHRDAAPGPQLGLEESQPAGRRHCPGTSHRRNRDQACDHHDG